MQGANLVTPHAMIGEQAGPKQRDRLGRRSVVIDEHRPENRSYSGHGTFLIWAPG
jgi:hypothetical protein